MNHKTTLLRKSTLDYTYCLTYIYTLSYKEHFYRQRQAKNGKISSKC